MGPSHCYILGSPSSPEATIFEKSFQFSLCGTVASLYFSYVKIEHRSTPWRFQLWAQHDGLYKLPPNELLYLVDIQWKTRKLPIRRLYTDPLAIPMLSEGSLSTYCSTHNRVITCSDAIKTHRALTIVVDPLQPIITIHRSTNIVPELSGTFLR